jgi:hypothetical protein
MNLNTYREVGSSCYMNFERMLRRARRFINGRGGGIRTPDPLVPNQMRYQTALRPDYPQFTV